MPVATWLLLCLSIAYLPDIGHGFISDDFSWIAQSRLNSMADLRRLLLGAPSGFYRPVVGLTFAVNEWLTGIAPLGYALVNVALVGAVAAALVGLCRARGFTTLQGLGAAAVWTFNIHGVGMALTWISGRTSLLATLFAVLAATALLRGRRGLVALWTALALGSKEEVLPLVLILTAWRVRERRHAGETWRSSGLAALRDCWPAWVVTLIYVAVRSLSGAMTPATAPSYYRLSVHWTVLLPNLAEYADRALTFATALVILAALVTWRLPRRADVQPHERQAIADGVAWLVLGFGVTILVPVRSDLYVCFPSIGASLMALAAVGPLIRLASVRRRQVVLALALLLPLLLVPVYRGRNRPPRRDAELSTQVLQRAYSVLRERPDLTRVEVYQYRDERPSVAAALGGGLPHALELLLGRPYDASVSLTSPSDPWPAPRPGTLRLTVIDDQVAAITPPTPIAP